MYKLLLCLRYLRTRYIALASIISVMLGVATMIVVNAVMAGFSTEMRDRIHGILADVIIETNSLDGTNDAEQHMQIIRDTCGDKIEGMTATVEVFALLSYEYGGQSITRPVTLIGIQPEGKAQVGPLVQYLDSYNAVLEDGQVIRQPLRSPNEVPNWELTDDAREYREKWVARQQWMYDRLQNHGAPNDGPLHDQQPNFDGDAPDSEPPFHPAQNVTETDSNDPPFADVPPFEQPFAQEIPEEPVDPAEPLRAKLYVGVGLVSYPEADPETGKVTTKLLVQPGDDVKISTVTAGRPPEAVHFNATVVDVFKSGMSEYDSNLVFCNLEHLQEVRGMIDPSSGQRSVTTIQIKLKDYNDADEVVSQLKATFPPGTYTVRTWEQKQGPLLAAVEIESAILNVLLFLIIAVAGFGILAIFFMIVVEKTKDIGILKALGASSGGVMSIFLSYGLGLGLVGSGVGVVLGLFFVKYINEIEDGLTFITGRKVFDETIYYFPEIPTAIHPGMVIWVAFGATLIAVLASILPARRASRLMPVQALRYE